MRPLGTGIVTATAAVIVTGLMTAMAIAGQPFTALAAGACLGICVSVMVEAAARVPWGRWLADPPGPGPDGPSPTAARPGGETAVRLSQRLATAFHEAGHAVQAVRGGAPFKHVTAVPGEEARRLVSARAGQEAPSPDAPRASFAWPARALGR